MAGSESAGAGAAPDAMLGATLGVILAGGQARRMGGGDKCLLKLGGRPMLEHVADRLGSGLCGLALNANGDPARFGAYGWPVLPDPSPDYLGPLAGVLAGLDAAHERGAQAIVTAAADTPFFPADLALRLAQAAAEAGAPAALAASGEEGGPTWDHPTFGYWRTALRGPLREALLGRGVRKVVAFADPEGAVRAVFASPGPLGLDPFFNVNTPADLAAAEAALSRSVE